MRTIILLILFSSCTAKKNYKMKERVFYQTSLSVYNSEKVDDLLVKSKDDIRLIIERCIDFLDNISDRNIRNEINYFESINIKHDLDVSYVESHIKASIQELKNLYNKENLSPAEEEYMRSQIISLYGFQDAFVISFLTIGISFTKRFVDIITDNNASMYSIFFDDIDYEEDLYEKYGIERDDPVFSYSMVNKKITKDALLHLENNNIPEEFHLQKQRLKQLLSISIKSNYSLVKISEY